MIALTTNDKGAGFQKRSFQVFLTAIGILGRHFWFGGETTTQRFRHLHPFTSAAWL